MSFLTKVLIILNLVMTLVYFAFTAALFSYRVDYKNKLIQKEKEYIELEERSNKEINRLRGEIRSRDEKIAQIERDRDLYKSERDKAHDDLTHWKTLSAQLQNDITRLTAIKDQLTRDLEEQMSKNAELQKLVDEFRERHQQAEQDLNTIYARLHETEDTLLKAQKNLATLEEQYIELSKKLNNAQALLAYYEKIITPPVGPVKVISGKVLAVSDTHNIVIISVGEDAEVKVGMEFTVYRGANYIGKIRVDKVDKEFSSALTLENLMKDRIQPGDDVTTSPF